VAFAVDEQRHIGRSLQQMFQITPTDIVEGATHLSLKR
jgi:hypothetical protein